MTPVVLLTGIRQLVSHHKNHISTILREIEFLIVKYLPFHNGLVSVNCRISQQQCKFILTGNDSTRKFIRDNKISELMMTQILPLLPKQRMQNLKLWPLRGGYSTLRKTTQRKINQTLIRFNYVMQKPQRNHSLSKYLKYLRKLRFIETALLLSCLVRVNVLVLYKNHLKFFHLKPCNLM